MIVGSEPGTARRDAAGSPSPIIGLAGRATWPVIVVSAPGTAGGTVAGARPSIIGSSVAPAEA
jgi:hypothetical protein